MNWRSTQRVLGSRASAVNFRSNTAEQRGLLDGLIARLNILGQTTVAKIPYATNNSATSITVGASGADYTSLITAYGAATAGQVIEIIDDSITLSGGLTMTKGIDGNGKSIKIKGKSTKTTINLFATAYPCQLSGAGASIEFENIILNEAASGTTSPFYANINNQTGFAHFINCELSFLHNIWMHGTHTSYFDNVTFNSTSTSKVIFDVAFNDTLGTGAGNLYFNNCTIDDLTVVTFVNLYKLAATTKQYNKVTITNSTIKIKENNNICTTQIRCKEFDIRGNFFNNSLWIGLEYTVSTPTINAYDAGATYTVGTRVWHLYNLWECTADTTGNAPSLTSNYWTVAKFVTGRIENNTITRTTYTDSGYHGIGLMYGAYNFICQNNIVDNCWWAIVVKGINNTIQYNATGRGANGIGIFANEQAIVRNNTCRNTNSPSIQYGPHNTGGTGVLNTDFKYNICNPTSSGQVVLSDQFARYTTPTFNNVFTKNMYYGAALTASLRGNSIDMFNDFGEFKTVIGDPQAEYIDPQWEGSDPTLPAYYKPTNAALLNKYDNLSQAIGAYDYK